MQRRTGRAGILTLLLSLAPLPLGCVSDDDASASQPGPGATDAAALGTTGGTALPSIGGGGASDAGVGAGGIGGGPTSPGTSGGGATGGTGGSAVTGGGTGVIGGSGFLGGLLGGGATGILGGTGGAAGTGGTVAGGVGGTGMMLPPPGPDDGDPSQPIVAVPGVACGPNPSLFGLTTTNVQIGGRSVHVAYPCNKHKGAPVTFILNLHGTMPVEELKLYQVAYFSANTLVNSHNFITAAPISGGSQWGNDDGGVDEPHLKAVIEWVYTTFKDFDIRAMWVGGHSWGAMFTTEYVCRPELADKVKGAILMSTFPTMPSCSSRISVINTNAEDDIASPLPQGNIPMQHGCGAAEKKMLGNNEQTLWPNCQKGFVHSNYLMFGKAHADYIDAEVVKSIADLIKQARP